MLPQCFSLQSIMEQELFLYQRPKKKQSSDNDITLEVEKFTLCHQTPLPLKPCQKHSNSPLPAKIKKRK